MKTLKIYLSILFSLILFYSAGTVYSQETFRCLEFKTSTDGIAAGDNGMVMKTSDGGTTWYMVESNTTVNLNKTTVIDGDNMVAAGDFGTIIKSTNSGETWYTVESNTTQKLRSIFINPDGIGFAAGNNGCILKTVDHGETWSVVEGTYFIQNLNSITMNSLGEVFVLGDKNTFALSLDTGATWSTPQVLAFELSMNFARFIDDKKIFASSAFGDILKSDDKGLTWEIVYSNTDHNSFYRINAVSDKLIAVGDNGKIVLSNDMGYSWMEMSSLTNDRLLCLNFADSNIGYAGGENGVLLKTTDGGLTWAIVEYTLLTAPANKSLGNNVNTANTFSIAQNYPNPFNPSTKISYSIPADGFVNMTVLDITGKEVSTLMNSFQKTGSYTLNFDAKNLSSGVYFYRINVNGANVNFTKTMKMLLVK